MVILPRKNEKDLRDIPDEIRKSMKLVLVDSMDQVLDTALRRKPKALVIAEPPKIVKPGDQPSDTPEREERVRRTTFPPSDQPPVVVDGLQ
jgi:ATP-dependent Lon protease